MIVKQLSVFLQNKPGHLIKITKILKNNNLDIRAINVSEGNDFGILRLIVDDIYKAQYLLKEEGYLCRLDDVLAVELEDKVGILFEVFDALGNNGINLNYIYSIIRYSSSSIFYYKPVHGELPSIIIKTTDLEKSQKILENIGVNLISHQEVTSTEN